jgi:serine/threonine-protein kinase
MGVERQTVLTTTGPSSYVHVAEIASGGMGRVELALRKEGAFKRLYAVKRLHSILVSDTAVREMFMEEARIAGLIRHPNVVSVLDVGEDADGPFLIMDYVEGASLASLLKRASAAESPIPIQVCVRIAREIALGLHAAHELVDHDGARLDVVHRDLSPQNVLFGFDGAVRITDFGIAKALGRSVRTSTGVLKGKLSYMSPEQLQFEEPDRRSDLFSLGVILFELLSGRRLYDNAVSGEAPRRILKEPPPDIGEERPEVPASLVQLLFELLAKEREKRPVDAKTVATRLDAVLAELVASEGPFELGGWLDGFAGDFRRERQAALAAAIAEAETRTPPKANGRSWRGPVLVAVALAAVAAAIGVAASAWTDVSGAPDLAAPASARASGDVRPLAHRESAGSSSVELAREETPTEPAEATQSPETDPQVATPELEIETPRDRGRSRSTRRRTPRPVMAMTQAVATVMTQATPPVTMTVTMAQREDGWDDWNSP